MSGFPTTSLPAALSLIEQLKNQLQFAELKIRVLEERLRLVRIERYGRGSEKLSDLQLELLEQEPGVSNLEVEGESQREPVSRSSGRQRSTAKHPGRQELPAHLPRVERILPCTPEQEICQECGTETVVIGYDESERLVYRLVNSFTTVDLL